MSFQVSGMAIYMQELMEDRSDHHCRCSISFASDASLGNQWAILLTWSDKKDYHNVHEKIFLGSSLEKQMFRDAVQYIKRNDHGEA